MPSHPIPAAALVSHAQAGSAVGAGAEELVLRLLYQLIVILIVTRVVVAVARRCGQTDAPGEILAGILLGPTCLGRLFPAQAAWLFHASTQSAFTALAQIGLVLLMLQIGLEFEFKRHAGPARRTILAVSLLSIGLPYAFGFAAAPWFHAFLPEPRPPELAFRLFFATAMSITAIPILGRIFIDLGISQTRIATLAIAAAAVNDLIGWLLLGVSSQVAHGAVSAWIWLLRPAGLLLFLAFMAFAVRPILGRFVSRRLGRDDTPSPTAVVAVLLAALTAGVITSHLGVFAIFGGFVVGVCLHDRRDLVLAWKRHITSLVNVLLLPIFFTYTGLRTDVGALGSGEAWALCAALSGLAFAGKMAGAYLGARLGGETRRDALVLGTSMNTRALMELIVINIGYDLGVLPRSLYTMFVIMAVVSTFITTPILRRLMGIRREQTRAPAAAFDEAASVQEASA